MRPAFATGRSAAIFSLFLALLVAGPGLAALLGLVDESKNYPTFAWGIGEFPWIQDEIFQKKGDIDIVFIGSSHMWTAVNTPFVQRKLSEKLNRRSEVITLGWNWSGYDALYSVASNLLEHRRVRMIVVYDENLRRDDSLHPLSYRMIQVGSRPEEFEGMPWPSRLQAYAGAVLGLPRHMLSLVRNDRLESPEHWKDAAYLRSLDATDLTAQLGSLRATKEMEGLESGETAPASASRPAMAGDARICTEGTPTDAAYAGSPLGPYQLYFARKFARLCSDHGTTVVALHIPVSGAEDEKVITERQPWSEMLGSPVDLVGIPGAALFGGIPPGQIHRYFYEKDHLNRNGQDLFTPLITPNLLKLYKASPHIF
jgi:hypothetical protein